MSNGYFRSAAILAKIEATEGVDSVPTGNSNAILCGDLKIDPVPGGTVERRVTYPGKGAVPVSPKDQQVQVGFKTELAGAGSTGLAPPWGVLARMCGLSETINLGTSVAYAPVSLGEESGSIYANRSGTLWKMLGARGNAQLMFAKDDAPYIDWSFIGRQAAPIAAALPAVTLSNWQDPLVVGQVNTPTFTLHGYPAILDSLSADLGNKPMHKDRPNAEYVSLPDRNVTGSCTIVAPPVGTKDFYAAYRNKTLGALNLVHGTSAGNIITFAAPKVQIVSIDEVNLDGETGLQLGLRYCRNTGDDEIKLTVT